MKSVVLILGLFLFSCTSGDRQSSTTFKKDSAANNDTEALALPSTIMDTAKMIEKDGTTVDSLPSDRYVAQKDTAHKKVYSNKRFKDVTVEQTGPHEFRIKGKGQIFEASFGWIIEDGHEELQQGYVTTDAGAPEWGNFNFAVNAQKKRPNATLHLVLYETSAKDGSRQYELPVPLY